MKQPVTISKRALIIGFGNPLREDDGLGWRAAELIESEQPDAAVIKCHQLTPELAEAISQASLVIFLDASMNQAPGEVSTQHIGRENPQALSHHLSPAQLMGFTEQLFGETPRSFLITCRIENVGWSEELSRRSQRSAERMAAAAQALVRESS